MPEVIRWALISSFFIFALGLISALSSRRQAKASRAALKKKIIQIERVVQNEQVVTVKEDRPSAMSMAAGGGSLNGEENLASVSYSSR